MASRQKVITRREAKSVVGPCVYALVGIDGRVFYIGATKNLANRVQSHGAKFKDRFAKIKILQSDFDDGDIGKAEALWIWHYLRYGRSLENYAHASNPPPRSPDETKERLRRRDKQARHREWYANRIAHSKYYVLKFRGRYELWDSHPKVIRAQIDTLGIQPIKHFLSREHAVHYLRTRSEQDGIPIGHVSTGNTTPPKKKTRPLAH